MNPHQQQTRVLAFIPRQEAHETDNLLGVSNQESPGFGHYQDLESPLEESQRHHQPQRTEASTILVQFLAAVFLLILVFVSLRVSFNDENNASNRSFAKQLIYSIPSFPSHGHTQNLH
jgi:hypothetical protein